MNDKTNTASKSAGQSKESKGKEIKGLFVRTAPGVKAFRRAGRAFNEAGMGFAEGVLTDDQVKALKAEKRLIVEETTFMDDAPNVVTKKADK